MRKFRFFPLVWMVFVLVGPLLADGHLEFSFHYSRWTLNLARGLLDNMVSDVLESDLKDRFTTRIQNDYPNLVENGYSQKVTFDAPGDNIGFELRYYPGGHQGAFSLGLAVEQSSMRVTFPEVIANLDLEDPDLKQTANFRGLAQANFRIKPLSFHVNLRWELLPSKVISPYLTLGAGLSTGKSFFDASYQYSYSGTLTLPDSSTKEYTESATKTLRQIKDERLAAGKSFALNFLPIVQMNFGLRAKISKMFNFYFDAGVFDGFLFRAGLGMRI
ncbi:MAG: hypothetical protein PHU81_04940 [Acidobacteriota bacterium]|nr:hypothetical protein [Acidobacteriota bacterium]